LPPGLKAVHDYATGNPRKLHLPQVGRGKYNKYTSLKETYGDKKSQEKWWWIKYDKVRFLFKRG